MKTSKWISYAIGIFLFILFASFFIYRKIAGRYVPEIALSSLQLKDLQGRDILLSNFKGKPLIINFWATWCGPCRQELPVFEKMKEKYRDQVFFLLVSDESIETIKNFNVSNKYSLTIVQSEEKLGSIGFPSVPFTYFYDKNGRLVIKKKDTISEDELNEYVLQMLKEK
jgi:thiol-disulfide isomerase/thioredoxin